MQYLHAIERSAYYCLIPAWCHFLSSHMYAAPPFFFFSSSAQSAPIRQPSEIRVSVGAQLLSPGTMGRS